MPKIRPATPDHSRAVDRSIRSLRCALTWAKSAHCPKLADKIRRALKSADGARRHVDHRLHRTNSDGSSRHYLEAAR